MADVELTDAELTEAVRRKVEYQKWLSEHGLRENKDGTFSAVVSSPSTETSLNGFLSRDMRAHDDIVRRLEALEGKPKGGSFGKSEPATGYGAGAYSDDAGLFAELNGQRIDITPKDYPIYEWTGDDPFAAAISLVGGMIGTWDAKRKALVHALDLVTWAETASERQAPANSSK